MIYEIPEAEKGKLFYKYHGFAKEAPIGIWQRLESQFKADLELIDKVILDDALASQYMIALPLLRERRKKGALHVIFAIPTGKVGQGYVMNWDSLKELSKEFEIASHAHTHSDLTCMSYEAIKKEIELSKKLIEENIGRKCLYFTAPYDRYNDDVRKACEELGLFIVDNRILVKNDTVLPMEKNYWDQIYSGKLKAQPGGNEHIRYGETDKHLEGNLIIDIGAGDAGLAKFLKAKHPELEIWCLDVSEAAAKRAQYEPYVVASCDKMPFEDKKFDLAICLQVMNHIREDEPLLAEAKRIAKKGIFTATNGVHPYCEQYKTYDKNKFARLIKKYGKLEQDYVTQGMIVVKVDFE